MHDAQVRRLSVLHSVSQRNLELSSLSSETSCPLCLLSACSLAAQGACSHAPTVRPSVGLTLPRQLDLDHMWHPTLLYQGHAPC